MVAKLKNNSGDKIFTDVKLNGIIEKWETNNNEKF